MVTLRGLQPTFVSTLIQPEPAISPVVLDLGGTHHPERVPPAPLGPPPTPVPASAKAAERRQAPEGALWTVDDVARFTRSSKSWVYQQASAGRLPCLKAGGLLRFDPAAVKQFFLSGGVEPERKVIPLKNNK